MRKLFTSESVTEGHPDKIADQISDAVLDAILAQDPNGRVACETVVTTDLIHIVGEISTTASVDIPKIARDMVLGIGYDRTEYGFDGSVCKVLVTIDEQSPDIARGIDVPWKNSGKDTGIKRRVEGRTYDEGVYFLRTQTTETLRREFGWATGSDTAGNDMGMVQRKRSGKKGPEMEGRNGLLGQTSNRTGIHGTGGITKKWKET